MNQQKVSPFPLLPAIGISLNCCISLLRHHSGMQTFTINSNICYCR